MIISVKICDFCDTCVYNGEYKLINGDVVCIICEEEKEEEQEEQERHLVESESLNHV